MLEYVRHKLQQFWQLCRKHRTAALAAAVFAFGAFILVSFSHPVLAQAPADPATVAQGVETSGSAPLSGITGFIVQAVTRMFLATARFFLSVTIFILTFIIEVAGYNGYIDANAVNVGWVMVRDLTNMLFIIALLIIAIGTILGLEHYEWKHMLVELVMAAVLVNFSRTICGLIIDAAQVVMNTFVNGIAATAAGNLINAFGLNGIFQISPNAAGADLTDMNVFVAGMGAVMFSGIVMCIMGMFLLMLVYRLVTLWVLIVLSPIGFTLRILPQTEDYAHEWWHEFSRNVIMGPVLLFFIWLAFVTVGNGRINQEINENSSTPQDTTSISGAGAQQTGIGKYMAWNDMANFIIACAMLIVGVEVAQKIGGKGANLLEEGLHAGEHLGATAAGITAAHWAGEKVVEGGKEAAHFALMKAPLVGGEAWQRRGKVLGSLASIGLGKIEHGRNEIAKDLEKGSKELVDLEGKYKRGELGKGEEAEQKYKAERDKIVAEHGGAGRRFAKNLVARVVQSGGRADKRAEDYEKAAEAQHHINEEDYSTSALAGGRLKLDLNVRAHQAEELAELKGQRKYAEKHIELLNQKDEAFTKKEDNIHRTEIEVDDLKKIQAAEKNESIGKEREKMETPAKDIMRMDELREKQKHGGLSGSEAAELARLSSRDFTADQLTYARRAAAIPHLEAVSKQMGELQEERNKIRLAKTKEHLGHDQDYTKRKGELRQAQSLNQQFEAKSTAKKQIELLDAMKKLLSDESSDFSKLLAKVENLNSEKEEKELDHADKVAQVKAKQFEKNGDRLRADATLKAAAEARLEKESSLYKKLNYRERKYLEGQLTEELRGAAEAGDEAKVKKLLRQKTALVAVNTASDSESSRDGRIKALAVFARDKEIEISNGLSRLAAELTRQVGGPVEANMESIKKGIEVWNSQFADSTGKIDQQKRQAALRSLRAGYETGASNSDLTGLGLIRETETGQLDWELKESEIDSVATAKYWAQQAAGKKADSILGMGVKVRVEKDGQGKITGVTDRGKTALVEYYRGKNASSIANQKATLQTSWNDMEIDNETAAKEWFDVLGEMQKVMGNGGYEAQLIATQEFVRKLVSEAEKSTNDELKKKAKKLSEALKKAEEKRNRNIASLEDEEEETPTS